MPWGMPKHEVVSTRGKSYSVYVNFPVSSQYATWKTSARHSCGGIDLSSGEWALSEQDCWEWEALAKFFHVIILENEGRAGRLWVWIWCVPSSICSLREWLVYSLALLVIIGLTSFSSVCWTDLASQVCSASHFSSKEVSPCAGVPVTEWKVLDSDGVRSGANASLMYQSCEWHLNESCQFSFLSYNWRWETYWHGFHRQKMTMG